VRQFFAAGVVGRAAVMPNEGDEADLRKMGIARAKDFALQFAADRQ
jgi:hypothetical protein